MRRREWIVGNSDGRPTPALPARAGIGLKAEHVTDLLDAPPDIGFIEVHAENYMGAGGPPHAWLTKLRETYPLSVHGVGLSIGGEAPLDERHLDRLAILLERYRPESFSEHLAWSAHDGAWLADLLPIAYDDATLRRVIEHVDRVQNRVKRRMLLENPSTYVAFSSSAWDEVDFLAEVARRTGCGLLLDVTNVVVCSVNHDRDPVDYVDRFPHEHVGEIHLAGYAEDRSGGADRLLIDEHGSPVADDAWRLYRHALDHVGPVATLIEWDNDVPPLEALLAEAVAADEILCAKTAPQRRSA